MQLELPRITPRNPETAIFEDPGMVIFLSDKVTSCFSAEQLFVVN